jgi:glycosyltransferase involved in cell wall biosynthesis
VSAYFTELAARNVSGLDLLANERNLGFTRTANRGMQRSRADVVLLNADTIVAGDWLGAIRRCAASDPRVGTITPCSNIAEIVSFPRFCADNRWPPDGDAERVAGALARAAVPTYPELPTGVGFCMFIRRALLDEGGLFDPAFGAGYGEENDLCLRAARAGWRNVLADDAFVLHVGGRSFEGRKAELSPRNTTLLLEHHPHYERMVGDYIAADPLAPLREAARLALDVGDTDPRGVLHVIHDHGGGTETHVRALIEASRERWRHCLAIAAGDRWQIEQHRPDGGTVTCDLTRRGDEPWDSFVRGICATFGIGLLHLHNISGCRDGLLVALAALGRPYGYTVHDLNFACPTITFLGADGMFCGGETDAATCRRCLAAQPVLAEVDIVRWRERHGALLAGAAFVIAPSRWAADMLARYFPDRRVESIVHGTPDVVPAPPATPRFVLPDDGVPTVAVLGAIGPDKGARRIERIVELARERDAPVRFAVIGYLDVRHTPFVADDARFAVHGRYEPRELPALLDLYRVALVLYPSAGPETFSYTLSEAWAAGRPVLVPPIGALAERVAASGGGWVMTEAEWRDESSMLDRIVELLSPQHRGALAVAERGARAVPHAALAQMAGATFALYERALAGRGERAAVAPLDRARVRDALGYRSWTPPQLTRPDDAPRPADPGVGARIAHAALAIRHTAVGRALYRVTPQPVLAALKARLRT